MTEYNERLLKNILQDYREENDEQLLKEIEDAKNDPLFQNKDGEAAAFAEKYCKKQKKNWIKTLVKVASILLVISIGFSFIPFTVEGRKSSVAQIIANFVNSEFVIFGNNENDNLILSYEGEFVPTYIPDGYSVKSVENNTDFKEIIISNSDKKIIVYREQKLDLKTNIDYENAENLQNIEVLGYKGKSFNKDGLNRIIITTDNIVLYITCNDDDVDLIGFAKLIEKR